MNKNLPIYEFKEEIQEAIIDNRGLVITAETGAGKSTQVPQFLLEMGLSMVVTQPRRVAVQTVAQRVADEQKVPLDSTVGYQMSGDSKKSEMTKCLFSTDGLAEIRSLMGENSYDVLVIDEVHEWNISIEALVAWAKLELERNENFWVVLMSATIEAQRLSEFFDKAPIIEVPGRQFKVEEEKPQGDLLADTERLLRQCRNVLVFQPGKNEIYDLIEKLNELKEVDEDFDPIILPLHGELSSEEQLACFKEYDQPLCVVATNVAQTSVTVPTIDAVVDSGMERRIELRNGIEGLYLRPISRADREQRKGRAGRVKAGIYIDHCTWDSRPAFPVAEILRTRLDRTVLRLMHAGYDPEEMEFFHQPEKQNLHDAKQKLLDFQCLTPEGEVTEVGVDMIDIPCSLEGARLILEGIDRGVADDVITIAAIIEMNGFINHKNDAWFTRFCCDDEGNGEHESDLLAYLLAFRQLDEVPKKEWKKLGIIKKKVGQIKWAIGMIKRSLRRDYGEEINFSSHNRQEIILSICSGMIKNLWQKGRRNYIRPDSGADRLSSNASCVYDKTGWVAGLPIDIEFRDSWGMLRTLPLLTQMTSVQPAMVAQFAPHLIEKYETCHAIYDEASDTVFKTFKYIYDGMDVGEEQESVEDGDEFHQLKTEYLQSKLKKLGVSTLTSEQREYLGIDFSFEDLGGREFRCLSCQRSLRMMKVDWQDYQRGEHVRLECPSCRCQADVVNHNPIEAVESGQVETVSFEDKLAALKQQFNAKV